MSVRSEDHCSQKDSHACGERGHREAQGPDARRLQTTFQCQTLPFARRLFTAGDCVRSLRARDARSSCSACATEDDEVVEYALERTSSPILVAEYQAMLLSKELLRSKLHEVYSQLVLSADEDVRTKMARRRQSPSSRAKK